MSVNGRVLASLVVQQHKEPDFVQSKTPLRRLVFDRATTRRPSGYYNFFASWTAQQLYTLLQSSTAWESIDISADSEQKEPFDADTLLFLLDKCPQLSILRVQRPVHLSVQHLRALSRRQHIHEASFGNERAFDTTYEAKDVDVKAMKELATTLSRGWGAPDLNRSVAGLFFGVLSTLSVQDVLELDRSLFGHAELLFAVSKATGQELEKVRHGRWKNNVSLRQSDKSGWMDWIDLNSYSYSSTIVFEGPVVVRIQTRSY